jgi:hypothetical protein
MAVGCSVSILKRVDSRQFTVNSKKKNPGRDQTRSNGYVASTVRMKQTLRAHRNKKEKGYKTQRKLTVDSLQLTAERKNLSRKTRARIRRKFGRGA